MKGGPGRSRRSRQRPEGPERGGLGKGDPQGVEGIVLTVVVFEDGGLPSPCPGEHRQRTEIGSKHAGARFDR